VPTLNGVDVRSLTPLWVPFVLINAGCTLRGVGQTLPDFTVASFPYTGVSGMLEVSGFAIWGVHLGSIMLARVIGKRSGFGSGRSPWNRARPWCRKIW